MRTQTQEFSVILTLTALAYLFGGAFQTHAQFVGKTETPPDLRGTKALRYLKQTGSYDSLAEAIKGAKAAAQPSALESLFIQRQKLIANDGAAQDIFGGSVAISGDTAVVGSEHDDIGSNSNQGSAYVFVRSGSVWTQQAKLVANDGAANDAFGNTVAISGDTIIVGAFTDDINQNTNQGSAYIFIRNGTSWIPQDKLVANDGAAEDNFGYNVSISGDTVLIGAASDDIGADVDQGSAYVFVRSGGAWTQQQKLTAADGAPADFFGLRVCLSGSTALVGAQQDDIGADADQGSVYVFTRSGTTWTQQAKLTASDGAGGDRFGISLDLSLTINGPIAVIGAWNDDVAGNSDQGSAYVFTRSQIGIWSQQQKLTADDGAGNDFFGFSVTINSVSGNTIVVGALNARVGSNDRQGKAYVFTRSGSVWTQQQKLTASDGGIGGNLGRSVAISGETVIAGAPGDTVNSNSGQGSAYIFNLGGASPFDFDGDGRSDVSIFRPSNGQWWVYRSGDGSNFAATFGTSTDRLVPGDYTGDGKADIAIFRPSNGSWYIARSEDNSFFSFPFGTSGDIPAPADFDGDGRTDAAVFRPSNGTWYILNSGGSGTSIVQFGSAEDKPVTADFDGDGKADIAIFRPSDGSWWYLQSSNAQFKVYRFGTSTDKPVQGDYTGDGKADIGVFRPATGEWFIQRSEDNSYFSFVWGTNGDLPSPADYDGDARTDAAVFRPGNSTWYMNRSTDGAAIQTFGLASDKPVPNAFVP